MRNIKNNSHQSSHGYSGQKLTTQVNDIKFQKQLHYKNLILKLPPDDMSIDQKYEALKSQLCPELPISEYDAAIKFICNFLNY